jgi:hypothetical protein
MATPVSWSYGPWRTQTQPTADPSQQWGTTSYDTVTPPSFTEGGGTGRGGPGITGTSEYGPMTTRELGNMWGTSLAQKGVGLGIGALTGSVPSAASLLGMAPKGMVTAASLMSALLGGIRGVDPEFGIPTEADIRDIADYQGQMAAKSAAKNAESMRNSMRSTLADISGVNQPDYNADPTAKENPDPGWGGWGTPSPESTPSENPDPGWGGWGGEPSGGVGGGAGGPGGDPGGQGSPSGDPSGQGGQGESGFRKGGVAVIRRPTVLQFGETTDAQPETVVSIPRSMFKPGRQQNEPEVMLAMKRLLRQLRG